MAQTGAQSIGGGGTSRSGESSTGGLDARDDGRHTGRTPAQWYCLLAGAALLLAGIFGFLADATFDTGLSGADDDGGNNGGALQGDSFLGFEVNGWHNVVHLLSGIVLLSAFAKRKAAKTVALAFGIVYGLVAIIGLVDGNDVLGLIPVNAADNILHIALSAVGILAALASPTDEHGRHRGDDARGTHSGRGEDKPNELTSRTHDEDSRFGRDVDPLTGKTRSDDQITRS
jgi:hypothetical protein